MRGGRLALSTVVLLVSAGCGSGEPPPAERSSESQQYAAPAEDVRGEYERFVRGWFDAYNRRDVRSLVSLYASDAIRMPPGAPAQRGPDEIRAGLAEGFAGLAELQSEGAAQQVYFVDGWAVERGTYTLIARPAADEEPMVERGKYVVVARRGEAGAWRIVWEIWNANTEAPEPIAVSDSIPTG